jgi:hypothetical protein
MSASGRYINWEGTSWTPSGGSATPITEVQDIQIAMRPEVRSGRGDADFFNTAKNVVGADPQITVNTQNVGVVKSLGLGARGSFTSTLNDANNLSGSGAITVTVASPQAVVTDTGFGDAGQQYATARAVFDTYSLDGVTSPITYTVAS